MKKKFSTHVKSYSVLIRLVVINLKAMDPIFFTFQSYFIIIWPYEFPFCILLSFTGTFLILKLLFLSLTVEPLSISDIVSASDAGAKVRVSFKVWMYDHDVCNGCKCVTCYPWLIICLDCWIRGCPDHTVRMLHSKLTPIAKRFPAMTLKKLLRFDLT